MDKAFKRQLVGVLKEYAAAEAENVLQAVRSKTPKEIDQTIGRYDGLLKAAQIIENYGKEEI